MALPEKNFGRGKIFHRRGQLCHSPYRIRLCVNEFFIGLVKFDLDVEVHVVPRDSYQPSPADSSDAHQSDTDDSYLSIENQETDDDEANHGFNLFTTNLERDPYKSYMNSATSTDSYELNPSTFGKVMTFFEDK